MNLIQPIMNEDFYLGYTSTSIENKSSIGDLFKTASGKVTTQKKDTSTKLFSWLQRPSSLSSRHIIATAISDNRSSRTLLRKRYMPRLSSKNTKKPEDPLHVDIASEDAFTEVDIDKSKISSITCTESKGGGKSSSDLGKNDQEEKTKVLHFLCETNAPYEAVNEFLHLNPELLDENHGMDKITGWINELSQSPLDVVKQLSSRCICGQCNINRDKVILLFETFRPVKNTKHINSSSFSDSDSFSNIDDYDDLISTFGYAGDWDEERSERVLPRKVISTLDNTILVNNSSLTQENLTRRDRIVAGLIHQKECMWYLHGEKIKSIMNNICEIRCDKKCALEKLRKGEKDLQQLQTKAAIIKLSLLPNTDLNKPLYDSLKGRIMILKKAASFRENSSRRVLLQTSLDEVCYDTGITSIYCMSLERKITDLKMEEARLEKYDKSLMHQIFGHVDEQLTLLIGSSKYPLCTTQ